MRDVAASGILAVWKRAAPRNRMREIFTSGSVGGLAEQSLALPGHNFDAVGVEVMQITRGILSISRFRNAAARSHQT
jgi:hypothetical protein